MSYYVIVADNADDMIYELIPCEHCKYFRKADEDEYRYKDSCDHPHGLVRPERSGFCNYAAWKSREEEDHE